MYELPTNAAGMIVLTFCDHEHNRFVPLAAFRFDRLADLDAAWQSIREASGTSAFLADRHETDGMVDKRAITSDWIERRTRRPIMALIAER